MILESETRNASTGCEHFWCVCLCIRSFPIIACSTNDSTRVWCLLVCVHFRAPAYFRIVFANLCRTCAVFVCVCVYSPYECKMLCCATPVDFKLLPCARGTPHKICKNFSYNVFQHTNTDIIQYRSQRTYVHTKSWSKESIHSHKHLPLCTRPLRSHIIIHSRISCGQCTLAAYRHTYTHKHTTYAHLQAFRKANFLHYCIRRVKKI